MESNQDLKLIDKIKRGDEHAFRRLFDIYYKYIVVTIHNILGDFDTAKDLAQDIFLNLWKNRAAININSNVKSYLRKSAVNRSLNHLKRKKPDYQAPETLPEKVQENNSAQLHIEAKELQSVINATIDALPSKCRAIFILCRLEGLSHKEIAEKLNISTKTVENQMTKALKSLRAAVAQQKTDR